MKHLIFSFSLAFLCALSMSGCDLAKPQNKGQGQQPVVQNDPPVEEQPQQNVTPQDTEETMVTVAAAPGLTGRGNYASAGNTSNPMSIISTPISQYFLTQDRIVLQQIEAAMNLYKGEHGRIPATHEEFVIDIIQANNIVLPRLPEGHTYVYDPTDGVLKVRKPGNAP